MPEIVCSLSESLKHCIQQMKPFQILLAFAVIASIPKMPAMASDLCSELKGASVVADDGTYLGKMEIASSVDSIFNQHGKYGNPYGVKTIWNEYGLYGGKYAVNSPFSKYTATPPLIYAKSNKILKLTVNKYLPDAINPYAAKACFM